MFNQIKKTATGQGRKRIEIKELDKGANKQVTFSKRRAGLFKKASELCILCNTQLAIIVFSPAGKPFCFGQPKAEAVLGRYLKGTLTSDPSEAPSMDVVDNFLSHGELNRQYVEATKVLEFERKRIEEIENLADVWDKGNWWDEPIDEMGVEQLEQYAVAMNELRRKLAERADELMIRFAGLPHGANPFGAMGAINFTGFFNQFGGRNFGF